MTSSMKLGNLPDELLVLILSFLPTWYAVRTSILSRRWQYLFTLTDCLSFDDAPWYASKRSFEKFVNKVLELHQMSPIRKFSLVCRGSFDESHLNAWVKHAIQKGVEEFHYQVNKYELPDVFAMCKTLVKLKVIGCPWDVPTFSLSSGLPSLKVLHLKYVRFDNTERLLSNCEFIEELTLDYCLLHNRGHLTISIGLLKVLRIKHCHVRDGFLEIEAPNLAYLTYYSSVGVKIVSLRKNSCSLVKANLHFNGCSNDRLSEDDGNILRAIAYKTTELHLLSDSVQCLLMKDDLEQVSDFHNLSRLHLSSLSYYSWKYVTKVLDKSPRLEIVVFEKSLLRCCYFPIESPPNECPIPFSCQVKVIEVHDYCRHEALLLFLRYFLRNARVLKKLILRKCHDCGNIEEERQIRNDLLMLPRASSDCCIEFK
ncbi:F-box protein At4g22280-like [Silene latifolia]|uniref:F-box protein At4g22280-like n=1 Tax=Silene latifolia TaxID=37657 RepID=UPI003D76D293